MNCLIRDDDISFLTRPQDLVSAWGWFLEKGQAKLNLAVIPFVERGEFEPSIKGVCPLGDNTELVEFVKDGIVRGKIEIMLHGFDHAGKESRFEFEVEIL